MIERIGSEVERELARHGPAATTGELVRAWPDTVGASIARNAWPSRVARDGTLHVAASSAAWAFELTHLAPALLERLRARLGDGAPRALRFAVGPVPEPASPEESERVRRRVEASAEESELGRALAAGIADEELRRLVARAAAASLARASAGRSF